MSEYRWVYRKKTKVQNMMCIKLTSSDSIVPSAGRKEAEGCPRALEEPAAPPWGWKEPRAPGPLHSSPCCQMVLIPVTHGAVLRSPFLPHPQHCPHPSLPSCSVCLTLPFHPHFVSLSPLPGCSPLPSFLAPFSCLQRGSWF